MTAQAAPAAPATPAGELLTVATRLFGPLRIDARLCFTFPDGLLGFGGERRFVLLPAANDGLYWLQAVDEPALAFLLVDPFRAFAGYQVELEEPGTDPAAGPAAVPPMVLAIVTLPRTEVESATANLQAPLVLDLGARRGRQAILPLEAGWSTRMPFDVTAFLDGAAPAGAAEGGAAG